MKNVNKWSVTKFNDLKEKKHILVTKLVHLQLSPHPYCWTVCVEHFIDKLICVHLRDVKVNFFD